MNKPQAKFPKRGMFPKKTKYGGKIKGFYFLLFQRRMSSDISPSLVNWMTSMMTMRLQVILEHIPVTQDQIQNYIVRTQVTDQLNAFFIF